MIVPKLKKVNVAEQSFATLLFDYTVYKEVMTDNFFGDEIQYIIMNGSSGSTPYTSFGSFVSHIRQLCLFRRPGNNKLKSLKKMSFQVFNIIERAATQYCTKWNRDGMFR